MTGRSEWTGRVGESWAREWERTDRSFRELTSRLIDVAASEPFTRALDIGCGAGEVSIALSTRFPGCDVVGLDISADLLAVARERAGAAANVEFALADAAQWTARGSQKPDLLVSRHGVMFFDDPVAAFAHLRAAAADDARLVFSCFRERPENVWARELSRVVASSSAPADPRAPGPFAFGEKDYVEQVLRQAGWSDVVFAAIDYPMLAGEGEDAIEQAVSYFLRIGPAAGAIAELEGDERAAAIERLRTMLAGYHEGGRVALPAACWIVEARSGG